MVMMIFMMMTVVIEVMMEVNDITGVTSTAAKARNRIEDDSPAGDDFDHDDGHGQMVSSKCLSI